MCYGKATVGKDCRDLESDCNDKSHNNDDGIAIIMMTV